MRDVDIDNKTIAVGDEVKKNTTINHEQVGGGGRGTAVVKALGRR